MQGHAAHWRALLDLFEGDLPAAVRLYERAIAIHREVGDVGSELTAAFQLAMAQAYAGRPGEALRTCAAVVGRATADGESWNRGYAHWVAAISHLHLGDLQRAEESIAETMRIEQDFRDGVCTALCIEVCSWIVAARGRAADAAALSGMSASVWRRLGTSLDAFGPHAGAEARRRAGLVDRELGEARAAALRDEYGRVGVQEAVRLGIELGGCGEPAPTPSADPGRPAAPLTSRENQIAELIASGLSNKAIARELTISPRTVDGHVERILRKLDFASRTQIASWVAASAARARP
jgi:DNA-binding CsgD family transcriptional regulator